MRAFRFRNDLSCEWFCGWLHALHSRGSASNSRRMVSLSLNISVRPVISLTIVSFLPDRLVSTAFSLRDPLNRFVRRLSSSFPLMRCHPRLRPVAHRRPATLRAPASSPVAARVSSKRQERATPPTGSPSRPRARCCPGHFDPRICSFRSSTFRLPPLRRQVRQQLFIKKDCFTGDQGGHLA